MQLHAETDALGIRYTLYKDGKNADMLGYAALHHGGVLAEFCIVPAWRRRGYGSYLLKEILRQNGGFARGEPSVFTAPAPNADNAAGWALAKKFGFVPQTADGTPLLCRRRVPDLTAVAFTHQFLRAHLRPGGLYLDATCGNGHDTVFLCGLAGATGTVVGLDIQPTAVEATNARLAAAGFADIGRAVLCDHRALARFAAPGTADCVLFNLGWLPGAAHEVHSQSSSTIPALQAALTALRPGGVLAVVLYSGKIIGDSEKNAVLDFLQALPPGSYTVLECRFANWAPTAPLPCFVLKSFATPP